MPIGTTPILIGGGVLLAAHEAGQGLDSAVGSPEDQSRSVGIGNEHVGWVFPLPVWKGLRPEISDGPGPDKRDGGKRSHNGCDIDYRCPRLDSYPEFKKGTKYRSSGGRYICPDVPVLAVRDGHIWSVGLSPRGLQIVIDHGRPFATYYQHMQKVFFPMLKKGAGKIAVKAGQPIGIVGNGHSPGEAPKNGFQHLHFEVWKNGGPASWIDPSPILTSTGIRFVELDEVRLP